MKYFPLVYINSNPETEILVEMIFSYKMEYVINFLKEKKLKNNFANKTELKKALLSYIEHEEIQETELVELLDNIEEYGNQHVYLFENSSNYINKLKEETFVKELLEENDLLDLYNDFKPVIIPNELEITSVSHNRSFFKIKWVEKRRKKVLVDEEIAENEIVQRYQFLTKRAINTFKIDLLTGNSELAIQKLPSGSGYDTLRDDYVNMLNDILDMDTFSSLTLRKAIKRLDNETNINRKKIKFDTVDDAGITFNSQNSEEDYKSSPSLRGARVALGDEVMGNYGNFLWLPNESLTKRVHTHIYPNRVGVLGEYDERELDYVFSRIRRLAR